MTFNSKKRNFSIIISPIRNYVYHYSNNLKKSEKRETQIIINQQDTIFYLFAGARWPGKFRRHHPAGHRQPGRSWEKATCSEDPAGYKQPGRKVGF